MLRAVLPLFAMCVCGAAGPAQLTFTNELGASCTLTFTNEGVLEASCPIKMPTTSEQITRLIHSTDSSDTTMASSASSAGLKADFDALLATLWHDTANSDGCRSPWFRWEATSTDGSIYSTVTVCFDNSLDAFIEQAYRDGSDDNPTGLHPHWRVTIPSMNIDSTFDGKIARLVGPGSIFNDGTSAGAIYGLHFKRTPNGENWPWWSVEGTGGLAYAKSTYLCESSSTCGYSWSGIGRTTMDTYTHRVSVDGYSRTASPAPRLPSPPPPLRVEWLLHSTDSSDTTVASSASSAGLKADFDALLATLWHDTANSDGCRSPWFRWEATSTDGSIYSTVTVCFDNSLDAFIEQAYRDGSDDNPTGLHPHWRVTIPSMNIDSTFDGKIARLVGPGSIFNDGTSAGAIYGLHFKRTPNGENWPWWSVEGTGGLAYAKSTYLCESSSTCGYSWSGIGRTTMDTYTHRVSVVRAQ